RKRNFFVKIVKIKYVNIMIIIYKIHPYSQQNFRKFKIMKNQYVQLQNKLNNQIVQNSILIAKTKQQKHITFQNKNLKKIMMKFNQQKIKSQQFNKEKLIIKNKKLINRHHQRGLKFSKILKYLNSAQNVSKKNNTNMDQLNMILNENIVKLTLNQKTNLKDSQQNQFQQYKQKKNLIQQENNHQSKLENIQQKPENIYIKQDLVQYQAQSKIEQNQQKVQFIQEKLDNTPIIQQKKQKKPNIFQQNIKQISEKIIEIQKKELVKISQYQEFTNLINFSNNIQVIQPQKPQFKIYVGKGNNSFLIKQSVKNRWWLQLVQNIEQIEQCQIVWTQIRNLSFINLLKPYVQEKTNTEENTKKDQEYEDSSSIDQNSDNNINNNNAIYLSDDTEATEKTPTHKLFKQNSLNTTFTEQKINTQRKFDIRCYLLITVIKGKMKAYWYQDGYIRTSCKEFNCQNLNNKMIHLTNDAVQKKCEDYGKYEAGNKLSYNELQRYLNQTQPDQKLDFQQTVYPRMKQLALDCVKATFLKMDQLRREISFEVFGLDFMIDQDFKTWLIEVNTNPCLELASPLLVRIIPAMIENAFRIAIDPIFSFPSAQYWQQGKKSYIQDALLANNKFELIFDENYDGPLLKAIYEQFYEQQQDIIIEEEEEEEIEDEL
ncbi:hypothetical protein IMG5_185430, partial [Ichthyophthirius multifiliis]